MENFEKKLETKKKLTKVGEIINENHNFRQFFEDWRHKPEFKEYEKFEIKAPFLVVNMLGGIPQLILEPDTETAVKCFDDHGYVGGGSYYGGRSFERVKAPLIKVQFHRYCLDRGTDKNTPPLEWPLGDYADRDRCRRHDLSEWKRRWQVVLIGDEDKLENHGDSYNHAAVVMTQKQFLELLNNYPCTCETSK